MKRTGRIIYHGAMAISLLLCLGCAGVWVRSYWVSDTLAWSQWPVERSSFDSKNIWSSRGGVQLSLWNAVGTNYAFWDDAHFNYSRQPASVYPAYADGYDLPVTSEPRRYGLLGFQLILDANGQFGHDPDSAFVTSSLTLPLYFPTLLFALLPAHYFLRLRRRRRIAGRVERGCCPACGYDLRASAGRCPECGLEAAAAQS